MLASYLTYTQLTQWLFPIYNVKVIYTLQKLIIVAVVEIRWLIGNVMWFISSPAAEPLLCTEEEAHTPVEGNSLAVVRLSNLLERERILVVSIPLLVEAEAHNLPAWAHFVVFQVECIPLGEESSALAGILQKYLRRRSRGGGEPMCMSGHCKWTCR